MKIKVPYILDAKLLKGKTPTLEEWFKSNEYLINELITHAATILIEDESVKTVNVIELFIDSDVYTVMSLDRRGLEKTIKKVIESWTRLENYERASDLHNLLSKINK